MLPAGWVDGVRDTFGVLKESLGERAKDARSALPTALSHFAQLLERHSADAAEHAGVRTLDDWRTLLAELERGATAIRAALDRRRADPEGRRRPKREAVDDSDDWARLLVEQCRAGADELREFAPLAAHDRAAPAGLPSLRQLATRAAGDAGAGALPLARRSACTRSITWRRAPARSRGWTRASCTTLRATC